MKCSRCGSTENIEKHHIIHRVNGGSNDIDNLCELCTYCHDYQHAKENIEYYINKCESKHQFRRLKIWQYRLHVLEEFNTPELILQRGYKTYWDDVKTHYMSREVEIYIPPEQITMKLEV